MMQVKETINFTNYFYVGSFLLVWNAMEGEINIGKIVLIFTLKSLVISFKFLSFLLKSGLCPNFDISKSHATEPLRFSRQGTYN